MLFKLFCYFSAILKHMVNHIRKLVTRFFFGAGNKEGESQAKL